MALNVCVLIPGQSGRRSRSSRRRFVRNRETLEVEVGLATEEFPVTAAPAAAEAAASSLAGTRVDLVRESSAEEEEVVVEWTAAMMLCESSSQAASDSISGSLR